MTADAEAGGGATRPSQVYAAGVQAGRWQDDRAQHAALVELDRIHDGLLALASGGGWLARMRRRRSAQAVRGLYYWGGVGRGKTFLVDLFYDALPLPAATSPGRDGPRQRGTQAGKYRTHFHRFMRGVHERLRQHAGQSDPLVAIARQWRGQVRVLVLDEFFVTDIGDAMLLARLLQGLFDQGVTVVTTSNTAPSDLYANGLQRERFLPAIDLLQRLCVVLEAGAGEDYRLRELTRSPVYRAPLDDAADAWLGERWHQLSGRDPNPGNVEIEGRKIRVRARAKGIVWFGFAELCEGPRSTADYIELAREFHTLLLSGVPCFDRDNEDAARRFVNLIDELYDRQVNLVCTAAALPAQLYSGTRLEGAFERAASRLTEMQNTDYLAGQHRA